MRISLLGCLETVARKVAEACISSSPGEEGFDQPDYEIVQAGQVPSSGQATVKVTTRQSDDSVEEKPTLSNFSPLAEVPAYTLRDSSG